MANLWKFMRICNPIRHFGKVLDFTEGATGRPGPSLDREAFVSAIANWLRWSGHTLPYGHFIERFPLPSGVAAWADIQHASAQMGMELFRENRTAEVPKPERFPMLALLDDGRVEACRGLDQSGKLVSANPVDAAPLALENVVGWVSIKIDSRRLHEEIFGTSGASADWFWKPFFANWWAYVQGGIAAALINILSIAGALYSMQVYDRVIPSSSNNTLTVLTVGVVLVYLFDFLLKTLRAFLLDYAAKNADLALSDAVFTQGVGVRMEARPQHMGTFISQLREHESVRDFLMSTTVFVLSDIPFIFLFLAAVWVIGGTLVYVPLIVIPLVLLSCGLVQWPLARYSREHVRESNARSGMLIEAIEGAETIKTLNAEWRMKRRWRELTGLLSETSMKMKFLNNLSSNIAASAQQVMYVGVIAMGALLVKQGEMTTGALLACSILASRALAPLTQLVSLISRVHHVRASARVLEKIMALPVDRPADVNFLTLERHNGKVSLVGTEFCYMGSDMPALQIPQLQINPGEKVAILGRTGSGKSTLLRLMSGLYLPTKGRILLDDVDIHQIDPARLRNAVGYMTQDVRLFAGTLKENLLLGAGVVSDDQLMEVARVTGIDRYISIHPRGFDLPIYEGGGGMSGGQRQSVGLARLMLSNPYVYLLDEPTAAMDQQTEREFIDRFRSHLDKERTLIMVTHKPSMLSLVDRVIILEQGRVVMDGARDEIIRRLSGGATVATAEVRNTSQKSAVE